MFVIMLVTSCKYPYSYILVSEIPRGNPPLSHPFIQPCISALVNLQRSGELWFSISIGIVEACCRLFSFYFHHFSLKLLFTTFGNLHYVASSSDYYFFLDFTYFYWNYEDYKWILSLQIWYTFTLQTVYTVYSWSCLVGYHFSLLFHGKLGIWSSR